MKGRGSTAARIHSGGALFFLQDNAPLFSASLDPAVAQFHCL
jgi:hypothetical protein